MDSEEQVRRRLAAAEDELAAQGEFGEVIVNDDLERALQELTELAARVFRR